MSKFLGDRVPNVAQGNIAPLQIDLTLIPRVSFPHDRAGKRSIAILACRILPKHSHTPRAKTHERSPVGTVCLVSNRDPKANDSKGNKVRQEKLMQDAGTERAHRSQPFHRLSLQPARARSKHIQTDGRNETTISYQAHTYPSFLAVWICGRMPQLPTYGCFAIGMGCGLLESRDRWKQG